MLQGQCLLLLFFSFKRKDQNYTATQGIQSEKKQGKLQKAVLISKSQVNHSCNLRIVNKKVHWYSFKWEKKKQYFNLTKVSGNK